MSAVHHLLLSQYMHLTDGRTDGQNCDSNTVRCITCSRTVKSKTYSSIPYSFGIYSRRPGCQLKSYAPLLWRLTTFCPQDKCLDPPMCMERRNMLKQALRCLAHLNNIQLDAVEVFDSVSLCWAEVSDEAEWSRVRRVRTTIQRRSVQQALWQRAAAFIAGNNYQLHYCRPTTSDSNTHILTTAVSPLWVTEGFFVNTYTTRPRPNGPFS